MALNMAKKASDKVLESFKHESFTDGIFNERYKWTGVATVQVFMIENLPLQTYDRNKNAASRFGTLTEVGDTMQELTISDDKCFNGAIDRQNNTSQMMIKSASAILKKTTDEVIIPYVDKYRLKKLSDGAGITVNGVNLTRENAVETIFNANARMSNEGVSKKGRVLFIGETLAIQLKLADQVVGTEPLAEKSVIKGYLGSIDGLEIRVVPDSYMPENVAFIIVKKGCAVAPKKIETYRVIENDKDIDGAIVQGRLLHDCMVFTALKKGVLTAKTTG